MLGEATVDEWEQAHRMHHNKKMHGAVEILPIQFNLYLSRQKWGSPPEDQIVESSEAQPVASSGTPQPVAGSLKSILHVEEILKRHPHVRQDTVQKHKEANKRVSLNDHLSPWDLEFHTNTGIKHSLGLTRFNDGTFTSICHGWVRFPKNAGKTDMDACADVFLNVFGFASVKGNGITKPIACPPGPPP